MIINILNKIKNGVKDWSVKHVHGKRATFWLIVLSFSEASFFLIPPDVLLVTILAVSVERWIFYSSLTTIFSVLGGIAGYLIGAFFFDIVGQSLIDFYGLQEQVLYVSEKFNEGAFWAIFLSALTPIPYKVFTISAGFFKIDFIVFMVASILGRGIRFFAVGYIMKRHGKAIMGYVFKYFDILSVIIIILGILAFFIFR